MKPFECGKSFPGKLCPPKNYNAILQNVPRSLYMIGRSPTVATNATIQAISLAVWKDPFSCKQCNYSSTVSSHLKKRLLSHSGEKLFSCSQCSFSCTQAGNLKIHNRTHSGEKAFNCDQCNYSTAQSAHLSQHMRKHTGEKLLTNATILAYKLVISKITSRLIQEKSCLSIMNVIIEAVKLQGWKYTSDSTVFSDKFVTKFGDQFTTKFGEEFSDSPNLVMNLGANCVTDLVTNLSPNLVTNLSPNLSPNSVNHRIRGPIYHQIWWRI